jgi:hypothetical protein
MSMKKAKKEWNDIDDYVWFMEDNRAVRERIIGIWRGYGTIYYLFGGDTGSIENKKQVKWTLCFNTKEQLLASL